MGIVTKNGDQGSTSNLNGDIIRKSDLILSLQGDVDEINAGIGFNRALLEARHEVVDHQLKDVQYKLFQMGAYIASAFQREFIKEEDILALEDAIDEMTGEIGELSSFIYYNGSKASAYAQVIRGRIRRCERLFVSVLEDKGWVGDFPPEYKFINRLSDYFFVISRYINYLEGGQDEKMTLGN